MSVDSPTIQPSLCLADSGGALKNCGVSALRVAVPISGAKLRLENAITNQTFNTTSNALCRFDFGSVQGGTYVLRIEGGETGRSYDPTEIVLKVRRRTSAGTLEFTRTESNCGDVYLMLSLKRALPE
jgi:hypothetical protein